MTVLTVIEANLGDIGGYWQSVNFHERFRLEISKYNITLILKPNRD